MSGICGIVNFDGRPVDPELLRKMAEAAAYRGPDGINTWIKGNVGLAHLALHTTPESLREEQPLVNRRGDLVLTADARVDNRHELIRVLTVKGYLQGKNPTDADLILAAYECWGEDCPKHIIGDFAFAIWDDREQKLFCARDPIGIRPLFYCQRGEALLCATTTSSVLAGLDELPRLNEPLIADFLCYWFDRWIEETVYESIMRLPASRIMKARRGTRKLSRYWDFGSRPIPRYKTDAEYVEHFRELFEEAVQCRLRSIAPIGISVSGGLDSSSIACMAHHILDEEDSDCQQHVRLYSYFFEGFPNADERRYFNAVSDKCTRFPATLIAGETLWDLTELDVDGVVHFDEPELSVLRNLGVVPFNEAHRQGCLVMLAGFGGDELLDSGAYWRPELIADVGIQRIGKELKYFWKLNGLSTVRKLIRDQIQLCVAPLVPGCVRWWRKLRSVPAWVRKERLRPPERVGSASNHIKRLPSRSANSTCQQLTSGRYEAFLSYLASIAAFTSMELRLPYLDRRMVDFLLVTPSRMRFVDGWSKVILREAMAGILPEEVHRRITAGYIDWVIDHRLRDEKPKIESLLNNTGTTLSDYLDVEWLRSAWQAYYEGTESPSRLLFIPLLLQVWLQSLKNRS